MEVPRSCKPGEHVFFSTSRLSSPMSKWKSPNWNSQDLLPCEMRRRSMDRHHSWTHSRNHNFDVDLRINYPKRDGISALPYREFPNSLPRISIISPIYKFSTKKPLRGGRKKSMHTLINRKSQELQQHGQQSRRLPWRNDHPLNQWIPAVPAYLLYR